MEKSLSAYKRVHFIGIKGAGMTALAEILFRRGVVITGSDTAETFFTDGILDGLGITYTESFAPANIPQEVDLIVYSSAYDPFRNPELAAALETNALVLSYPEAIGRLTQEKMTIAVAGSHGKTTTTALLAETLKFCGRDPLAVVGGRILSWEGNALTGAGEHFVLEADEYQDKLALYQPFGAVLTSIDWDHPDFFPDAASYEMVFRTFVERIPVHGFLVFCNDSASVKRVADRTHARKISYGFLPGAEYHITRYQALVQGFVPEKHSRKQTFSLESKGQSLGDFSLQLAGRHNALNAAAAVAVANHLKLDIERVRTALGKFSGTERRLELMGERYGAPIYDDYAHHPEEIRATLLALRELYPERRIRAIFQPHTFSRTEALFSDFAQSFEQADVVNLLPIYASAREAKGKVTSKELVTAINQFFPGKAISTPNQKELTEELLADLGRQDVVVTLGAGTGWQIARRLAKKT